MTPERTPSPIWPVMHSVHIPSVTGKQGAYSWALNRSWAAMIRLKSGRLLKFLPMCQDYMLRLVFSKIVTLNHCLWSELDSLLDKVSATTD